MIQGVVVKARFFLNSLFLTGAVILATAASSKTVPTTTPSKTASQKETTPQKEYINSSVCASCHSEIYENFHRTGMSKSLLPAVPANTMEDFKDKHEFYHALSDTHYSMIFRDGAYYQRRWQIGINGAETNVEEMKIDYFLGSGDQARSYLHRTARGTLIELPLGWYSEKGGYWAMSPGFDSRHPQTRRMVSYECMFCHAGYPRITAGTEAYGVEPTFSADLVEGVDCQRCHGPGSQHVRIALTPGANPAEIIGSIVNPKRLDSKLQMDVCMQCHLEPTSGNLPALVRRFDRGPFSFIAGQPLTDFIRYFDYMPGTKYDDRFELESAAYRLRKSRCFLESKGALTCLNCHNPHRVLPTGEEAKQYYAKACRQCHEPALDTMVASGKHTASSDCISCHMPKRRTDDIVHAIVTDHLIQRRLPKRDLLAEIPEVHLPPAEEYHGKVIPYYPASPPKTSENLLYEAVAQVLLQNNLQQGVADLSREMSLHPPRQMQFYTVLGDAWQNSGKPKEAAEAYEQAVQLKPDSVPAMLSLANALKGSKEMQRSEEVLKRALQISPSDPNVWYQYGILDAELGHTSIALEKVQKALDLNPDIPGGYVNLASLLAQSGQMDSAESALQTALKIDPYDALAYDMSGRIAVSQAKLPEALYDFKKAARLRPSYAPYLYNYALMLIRSGELDEAQVQAQATVHADPNFAEGHELLGGLLAKKQQLEQAVAEYQQAVTLKPDFSRANFDLGLLLAAKGDTAGAAEHLRKAATGNDPDIAKQAATALQRMGTQ